MEKLVEGCTLDLRTVDMVDVLQVMSSMPTQKYEDIE